MVATYDVLSEKLGPTDSPTYVLKELEKLLDSFWESMTEAEQQEMNTINYTCSTDELLESI